jgi:hypothetical protein
MLTDLKRSKYLGKAVTLFPMVKIVNPKCVEIGYGTQIDDFTFINAGTGTPEDKGAFLPSSNSGQCAKRKTPQDIAALVSLTDPRPGPSGISHRFELKSCFPGF